MKGVIMVICCFEKERLKIKNNEKFKKIIEMRFFVREESKNLFVTFITQFSIRYEWAITQFLNVLVLW